MHATATFRQRIESLRYRIDSLPQLRSLVGLPRALDIRPQQWSLIHTQLGGARKRLLDRIAQAVERHDQGLSGNAELNASFGAIELDLSKAFTFFDTYMDVLTQRHSPELGPLLSGCDALAWDALDRPHPALRSILRPLVYCDRGFGASFLREGVPMPDRSPNPLPLIQIPYTRLREKHTLTSILHEAGHDAMNRMQIHGPLAEATREAVVRSGADPQLADLLALWTREIGPDFWTFGTAGSAQASSLRELLALPPREVYRISPGDPHPAPLIRVLLSIDWCRYAWGNGLWDGWESEWLDFYPPNTAPAELRPILDAALRAIPVMTAVLFTTRFRVLENRTIPELFDLAALEPRGLAARMKGTNTASPEFLAMRPCEQLSLFRWLKDTGRYSAQRLDEGMTKWLVHLAKNP